MNETIIEGPLYEVRKKVYPQAVHGRFRRIKWAILAFALSVYYLLPFVRWNRGPGFPSQAVLVDFPHRRFYFFFIKLWPQEVLWIAILTATTYIFAGHAREQVCIYMCPWPRIQAALTDEWALNVTYRVDRGEPRVSVKKAEQLRLHGEPAGDCIDCHQCVNVCPTGVDIRDGIQLGCIQCGLCIDACDTVMSEIGRPTGLIAYDTDINGQQRQAGKPPIYRLIRARTVLYAAIISIVGSVMLYALATRASMSVNVLHDRNPLFVLLSDGGVRNSYTVRILNKGPERTFVLDVSGLRGAELHIPGTEPRTDGRLAVEVGQDQTREIRLSVQVKSTMVPQGPVGIEIKATDTAIGQTAVVADHFVSASQ